MKDLVSRLRAMAGPIEPNVCTEAADEIERLRAQIDARRVDHDEAIRQRDEARRRYCYDAFYLVGDEDEQRQLTPQEIASRMGWPLKEPTSEAGR